MKLRIHQPSSYFHFSVADRVTEGWNLQVASARRYKSEVFLNLAPLPQPFRFAMKMECLKTVLPQLQPSTLLVMLDAMDVLFNNSLDSLIATYHEIVRSFARDSFGRSASIICNGEKNCWPIPTMAAHYPESALATPFPFLNSGVLLGPCGDILRVLQNFPWDEKTDDQFYWMHSYMESKKSADLPRIEIDHHGRMACCMHALLPNELIISHEVAYLRSTGIRPALLHLNGPVKKYIRQVASKIGVQFDNPAYSA